MAMIRFYKPTLKRKDMDAVLQTMVDEQIGPGERKREFLRECLAYLNIKGGGIALRTYPDAIKLGLELAGVESGTKVGVSVLSPGFYGPLIKEMGAHMVLGDIDPEHGCLSASEALRLRDEGATVLLIHEPAGMIPYGVNYRDLGISVVEDVTQSFGSMYEEVLPGSFGDIVVGAFEEDGIISTGGGAFLGIAHGDLRQKLSQKVKDIRTFIEMPDMNAALGVIQLALLPGNLEKRREVYNLFKQSLMKTSHKLFGIGDIDYQHNGFCFPVVLDSKVEDVVKFAHKYEVSTVKTFSGCVGEAHVEKFEKFPNGIPCILRGLSFPVYPFLKGSEIEMLKKVISHLP